MNYQLYPMLADSASAGGEISYILFAVAAMAIGITLCFFGYRIFKAALAIFGAFAGSMIATTILVNNGAGQALTIIGSLAGAVAGAGISVAAWFVGLFILGFGFGASVAFSAVEPFTGAGSSVPLIVSLALGVLTGVAALYLQRIFIVVSTAFIGAMFIISGVLNLTGGPECLMDSLSTSCIRAVVPSQASAGVVAMLGWFVLAVFGLIIQVSVTAKNRLREDRQNGRSPVTRPVERKKPEGPQGQP